MKRIRQISHSPILSLFLCLTILTLQSCSKDEPLIKKQNLSGEQMFREIILLQGENVAKKIPYFSTTIETLKNDTPEEIEQRKALNDEIINGINISNRTYFSNFKKIIESDDLFEINKALTNGAKLAIGVMLKSKTYGSLIAEARQIVSEKKNNYDLRKSSDAAKLSTSVKSTLMMSHPESKSQKSVCLAIAAVVVLVLWEAAAAVNVVAVATVAVYAWAVFWGPSSQIDSTILNIDTLETVKDIDIEQGLDNNKLVLSIVDNY